MPQAATPSAAPSAPPARATWHAEPARVFDNLYFVGQSEYSAWAITTSEGIILIDAIYDYSVEDEVVGGLTALGLDPKQIKIRGDQPRARRPRRWRALPAGSWRTDRHVGRRLGSAGPDAVSAFLTVAGECAQAGLAR